MWPLDLEAVVVHQCTIIWTLGLNSIGAQSLECWNVHSVLERELLFVFRSMKSSCGDGSGTTPKLPATSISWTRRRTLYLKPLSD